MDMDEVVIGALSACTSKNLIFDTFKRYDINDFSEKTALLNKCMGSPKTFFSAGNNLSEEEIFNATVQMFLTGAWKIAQSL